MAQRATKPNPSLVKKLGDIFRSAPALGSIAGKVAHAYESVARNPITRTALSLFSPATALAVNFPKDFGVTEATRTAAGAVEREKAAESGNAQKIAQLEQKTKEQTGEYSAIGKDIQRIGEVLSVSPSSSDSDQSTSGGEGQPSLAGKEFTADALRALGVNPDQPTGAVVTIGGKQYRMVDTGRGTRKLEAYTPPAPSSSPPPLTREELRQAVSGSLVEKFLPQEELEQLFSEYAGKSRSAVEQFARDIESRARQRAEEKYRAIIGGLERQRGLAEQIAERRKREVEEGYGVLGEELEQMKESEIRNIEKQQREFEEQLSKQKEELGRTWRELSMEIQRLARARGISDSAFAAYKEALVHQDLNRGLRNLQTASQKAMKDFADAIQSTLQTYNNEKKKLALQKQSELSSIDEWLAQVQNQILTQENLSLAQKLEEIDRAIQQADALRLQIEQDIAQKQLALGTWLVQTKTALLNSLAQAAYKSQVAKAAQSVKATSDIVKQINKYLINKAASIEWDTETNSPMLHFRYFNPQTDKLEERVVPASPTDLLQQAISISAKSKDVTGTPTVSVQQALTSMGVPEETANLLLGNQQQERKKFLGIF